VAVFVGYALAGQRHEQHETVEVAREHDVAATAQHERAQALSARIAHDGGEIGLVFDPARVAGTHVEAKRVVRAQRKAGGEPHGRRSDGRLGDRHRGRTEHGQQTEKSRIDRRRTPLHRALPRISPPGSGKPPWANATAPVEWRRSVIIASARTAA
jgi:hypothetical protein